MTNELEIFSQNNLNDEERKALDLKIDEYIDNMEGNRKELNRLVFECTAAMTQADDISRTLKNKKGLERLVGSLTGSNKALQDKINKERANAQYASQRCLQKLAERNVMTFELITAVNNKLNASLLKVNSEFTEVYNTMSAFYKKNRNELVRLESRLDKVERNVKLLNWQNSIEYQDFNGIEYVDLTPIEKIVCLARDFYDITGGNWSTSDLLLLKTAMATIDISPKARVNYGQALNLIASNRVLKDKLLGQDSFGVIDYPEYMISFSGMQMLSSLSSSSRYVIDTIEGYMEENNIDTDRQIISQLVANKYLANVAQVDVNVEIECFDFLLDLLYNLENAVEGVINTEACEPSGNRAIRARNLSSQGPIDIKGSLLDNYDSLINMANNGRARAMYLLSVYYSSYKINLEEANEWLIKANDAGDALAKYKYESTKGNKQFGDCIDIIIHLADNNDAYACATLADIYGYGTALKTDYDKAVKYYQKAADLGNAYAMSRLGDLYLYGSSDVLPVNPEKACELYKASAQLGYVDAMKTMGYEYLYGDNGITHDSKDGIMWLKKAAEAGDENAMWYLALEYNRGENVGKNLMAAKSWLRKAAEAGSKDAMVSIAGESQDAGNIMEAISWYEKAGSWRLIGNMYLRGEGVAQNISKGLDYYNKAIDDGDTEAMVYMGNLYIDGSSIDGISVPVDTPKGLMYYEIAINRGCVAAINELAQMYMEGTKIHKDLEKAFELYKLGSEQGSSNSMVELAKVYINGLADNYGHYIVRADINQAITLLESAAKACSVSAMELLGDIYYKGDGVIKDIQKAANWYKQAVEEASWSYRAKYKLGRCFVYGEGIMQSYWKAVPYLKEAADLGWGDYQAEASYLLGVCYCSEGAQQDLDKAIEYLNQAAVNLMHPQHDAYYYLGFCYLDSGKQQNLTEAVNCFMQAAEAKCEHSQDAMLELGKCYEKGLGVKRDLENAKYWYTRSGKVVLGGLCVKKNLFSIFS